MDWTGWAPSKVSTSTVPSERNATLQTPDSGVRTLQAQGGFEKAQHPFLSEDTDTVSASSRPTFKGRRNHELGAAAGTKYREGMYVPPSSQTTNVVTGLYCGPRAVR